MITPARTLALATALAVAGCHPRTPPPDLSLDPAALLAQVVAAQGQVRSVRGEVRVKIDGPGASGVVPAFAAAERPDRLYVEIVDFFGNSVAVLAAAGGALSYYDARERVLYRGAATAENLSRLLPLPLSPAELVTILCGSAPLLVDVPVHAAPGAGFVTLELAGGDRTQSLRVGAGATVLRSALRVGGAAAPGTYDLELEGFDASSGWRFPGKVTLAAEAPRVRLELVWREVEPNAAVEGALFSPPTPRGARVVDLADAPPPAGPFPPPP